MIKLIYSLSPRPHWECAVSCYTVQVSVVPVEDLLLDGLAVVIGEQLHGQ